jgi:drug/metabolite transporter (DMT)-like permease
MSTKRLDLLMNILKIGLGGLGVILCIMLFNAPNVSAGKEAVEAYRDGSQMSAAIWFTFFLMFALMAVVVVFFLLQLITDTRKTVIAILGILISTVIYLIFLGIGTSDTTDTLQLKNPVSQAVVSNTTAGIYTIFIGMAVGALVIILGPFMGRLRK